MGVPVNRFQQIFLAQYKNGDKTAEKLASSVWKIFYRQGQRLFKDGKAIESPEENISYIKSMAEGFLMVQLPIFEALGL